MPLVGFDLLISVLSVKSLPHNHSGIFKNLVYSCPTDCSYIDQNDLNPKGEKLSQFEDLFSFPPVPID